MSANKKVPPLEAKAVIEMPLEDCYKWFLDYRNVVEATEWLYSVSLKAGERVEEGSIFVEKRNVRNNQMVSELTLGDIKANESFTHVTALPKMTFSYLYTFEAVDDHTTLVEVKTKVVGRGLSKLTAPVMEKEISKECARIIKDVKEFFGEEV